MAPRGGVAGNRGWARPLAGVALLVVVALLPGWASAAPASSGAFHAPMSASLLPAPKSATGSGADTPSRGGGTLNSPPPTSANLTIGTSRWTVADSNPTAPPGPLTSIVYDPSASAVIAFGGEPGLSGGSPAYSNQTWTFASGHWTQGCNPEQDPMVCGATPPNRAGAILTYDPAISGVLMTGGVGLDSNGTMHEWNDLWEYSGGLWVNASAKAGPPGLYDGAMLFDPATNSVVALTDAGVSWTFVNGTWYKLINVDNPPARTHPALFYDPIRRALILYGGEAPNGRTLNDTWAYTSSGWYKLNVGSMTPTSRTSATQVHLLPIAIPAAFDSVRGVGVVVDPLGDGGNETWLFNGDQWVNATSSLGLNLPTGSGASLAFDSADGYGLLLDDQQQANDPASLYLSDPLHIATSRLAPVLDANQSQTWSPTLSGGLPPYSTQMVVGENHCTLLGEDSPGPVATCPEPSAGTDNITLQFIDGANRQTNVNYTLMVHADPTLGVRNVHPDPTSVGVGVDYGALVSLGTPPYANLVWTFDDGTVVDGASPVHLFNTSGTHEVAVTTTDSVGFPVTTHFSLVVNPGPSAQLAVNLSETDPHLPIQFNATVVGGTGTTTCAWQFGDGTSSEDCSPVHSYLVHGEYTARFWTNDSVGASGTGFVRVGVAPSLLAILGGLPPAFAGQSVGLSVVGTGGVAPYTVSWSFGDGGVATGATVEHSYGSPGTYATQAIILDAVGGRSVVGANLTVSVDGSSLPGNQSGTLTIPSPSGSLQVPLEVRSDRPASAGPWPMLELLVAVALGGLMLFLDRRRDPPEGPRSVSWLTKLVVRARDSLRDLNRGSR